MADPMIEARNRLLQTHRDHKRRAKLLAKMDASFPITFVKPGIYHLIPAVGEHLAKMDALSQKCHVIPVSDLRQSRRLAKGGTAQSG